MRLLLAEDERSLSKALVVILQNPIMRWMLFMMDNKPWII